MEIKFNYPENTLPTIAMNQILQQQPCIPYFDLNNLEFCQRSNNKVSQDCTKLEANAQQSSSQSSSSSFSSKLSQNKMLCKEKPMFHSPQIKKNYKCQLSQMKLRYLQYDSIQPQSIPFHPFQNQIQSASSPYQLKYNNSSQSTKCYTPKTTSAFEVEYHISTPEKQVYYNNNNNFRNYQQEQYGSTYPPPPPFFSLYNSIKTIPSNNNNMHQESQQCTEFVNHYNSPNLQPFQSHPRKQSFNSSTSTSYDDSIDYQYRPRSGSYKSYMGNNHIKNQGIRKQIEEKHFRKLKKPIKHYQRQEHSQTDIQQQNENIYEVQANYQLEQINESDHHRITNEDLIITHQEQMKEEQNYQNKHDQFNLFEKKEELDNLEDITLELTHKQNYGCSMIDSILDEWENDVDEFKTQKMAFSKLQNDLSKIDSLGDLECQSASNLVDKSEADQNTLLKNQSNKIQNNEDNFQLKLNSISIWQNINQTYQNVEQLAEKSNEDSFEKIISKQHELQENISLEEQIAVSQIQLQNGCHSPSLNNLNSILDEANKHIDNPKALFLIVQNLAQQIREKDQTIKSMEQENNNQNKSLSSIMQDSDSKIINYGLQKLSLSEKSQQQLQQQ